MIKEMAKAAKEASFKMANASTETKNRVLLHLAKLLLEQQEAVLKANDQDIKEAKSNAMSPHLLDRLILKGRIEEISEDVTKVADLQDPVGEIFDQKTLANGLSICKKRTPLGVIGVIYEARPNVSIDVASLAIKTGNTAILRGSSETLRSNLSLVKLIQEALSKEGLPSNAVQLISSTDRLYVRKLLQMHESIDMIIPRGGEKLHTFCRENSTIPVITGGIGICHLFVDESAEQQKALSVILNAKIQRPTVCNALDTVLLHKNIAKSFLPTLVEAMQKAHVDVLLDPTAYAIYQKGVTLAKKGDFDKEWLSLTLGIKIVDTLNDAIAHIRTHSTGHSDGILTEENAHADRFVQEVDSSVVYVNASTRFTDGSQLGLGAEVAISTQKLHARGPMGLKELTTYKWIVLGNYHTR